MTDPTQSAPDGLNPERCPIVFAPYEGHPETTLRCTARADEHEHHWDSDEQQRWADETRRVTTDYARGLDPDTAYRVRVNGGDPVILRTAADKVIMEEGR